MQDTLARLYASVLQFMSKAILWYKQGKLKKFMSSINNPWELSFQDTMESIKEDSIRLDKLSDIAAKAELRDTHVEVIEIRKNWVDTNSELGMMRQENQRLADFIKTGMSRLDSAVMCEYIPVSFPSHALKISHR